MSTLRVQAPDGTTGSLDDAGNFTPDAAPAAAAAPHAPRPSGPSFDPGQDVEGEADQLQGAGNGPAALLAKVSSKVAQAAPAIAAFQTNAVPFGLGPKVAGVAARAAGAPVTQQQIGDAADQLSTENPRAALAGKVAGVATELPIGAGVEEAAASGLGKLLPGIASKVAKVGESSPVLVGALKTGVTGAAYGAAGAAGEAASHDQDVGDAAVSGARAGGITGAVLGGVAGKIGKLFKGAPAGYQDEFAREFIGASLKKDKQAFNNILNKEAETNVPARAADTFLQSPDLRPVRDALLDKNYSGATEEAEKLTAPLLQERAADYADLDKQSGGIEVGKPFDELRRALFKAANGSKQDPVAAKALSTELQRFQSTYSSAPAPILKSIIAGQARVPGIAPDVAAEFTALAAKLPKAGDLTRTAIGDLAADASPKVQEFLSAALDPSQGIMSWNPAAKIPTVEFRGAVSTAQKNAVTAVGALNATDAAAAKAAVKGPLNDALETHLDSIAKSGPQYQSVVDAIRRRDVKLSVLATIDKGINKSQEVQATARFADPLHKRIGRARGRRALALPGVYEAAHDVKEGHLEKLPQDVGFAVAGAVAPQLVAKAGAHAVSAIRAAATNGGGILQRLQEAATAGNPRAVRLLNGLRNAGARGAAAVGSAVSGTLAQ